jgi:hypothetical protein
MEERETWTARFLRNLPDFGLVVLIDFDGARFSEVHRQLRRKAQRMCVLVNQNVHASTTVRFQT